MDFKRESKAKAELEIPGPPQDLWPHLCHVSRLCGRLVLEWNEMMIRTCPHRVPVRKHKKMVERTDE